MNDETPKQFTIEAALGRQTITAGVPSDKVDEIVAYWGGLLKADNPVEQRSDTRAVIVTSLNNGTHHTNPEEARALPLALVWLAATGPRGEEVLDLMRGGDTTISYQIRQLRGDAYHFQLKFEDKSGTAPVDESNPDDEGG
jgi:hypothetical protein